MKKRNTVFSLFFLLLFVFLFNVNLCISQEDSASAACPVSVNIGSDFVSRYIWRGLAFDESFCVQPAMSLSAYNFTLGLWGSYSVVKEIMDECDFYLSYTLETNSGNLSAYLYDYHNPNFSGKFLNFKGDGEGAHQMELYLQFDGSEKLPITFLIGYNIHNDPDNSKYFEIGYKHTLNNVDLNLFIGATKGISDWYQVDKDKFAVINTGINASKKIKITNDFSINMGLSYILNAYIEKSYLVFKISL